MKTKLTLFVISILFLSACSTTYYSSVPYDDVYYSGQAQMADNQIDNSEYNEAEVYEGEYESEYVEDEYQDEYENPEYFNDFDAYYNYLFSARLRRFHRPYYSFGYYNNYFTNMYWYELNPYAWGSSIYLNTSWMMPYEFGGWSGNFYAGMHWGFGGYGMGWPYYDYGWPYGFGHHNYYGIGFSMYPSYYGYGYYNPYHYRNYYYNSRDSYSHYYRHRPNRGRNYNRPNGQLNTFGEMYEKRYYASRADRNSNTVQKRSNRDAKSFTNKSLSVGTPATGRNRSNTTIANGAAGGTFTATPYSRLNNASGNSSIQKNTANRTAKSFSKPQDSRKSTSVTTTSGRRNLQNTKSVKTYKKATLRYAKPNATKSTNNRSSNTKQFKSEQRYSNPAVRSSTPSSNKTRTNSSMKSLKRVVSTPTRSSRSYTSPSRSNSKPVSVSKSSGKRTFSTPSRSSSSRSISSPSRSSRSVSSTSRSSSSVSRSSSSSSKSTSGSSSRGRRK